ncbi:MAG TPA: hypothetical protein DCM40_20225, partial [Maribacter sp.]|nr:hypothetical protein [Maribacter sp.]
YSRPSAFGPPIAGLNAQNRASVASYLSNTIADSFTGLNPAYTPPYYNGEAWCDIIYRPTGSGATTIEEIMANCTTVYWRMDPGYASSSFTTATNPATVRRHKTCLIYDDSVNGIQGAPYEGAFINQNSMQISASINLFGIETSPQLQTNVSTKQQTIGNTSVGSRWVISPKFETPMMNFN